MYGTLRTTWDGSNEWTMAKLNSLKIRGLWNDESLDGQIIDNQPVFEPNVNWRTPTDSEIMKYFIFKNKVLENG